MRIPRPPQYPVLLGALAIAAIVVPSGATLGQTPAQPGRAAIDHVILGVRSLEAGISEFTGRTGVTPVRGGRHRGGGTENALVKLGDGLYLEIIAAVPGETPRSFAGIMAMERLTPAGWALGVRDLPGVIERLKAANLQHMGPLPGSRQTPGGSLLSWRAGFVGGPGLERAPFLIEWGEGTAHPSSTSPGGCSLSRLTVAEPDPGKLNDYLTLVGLDLKAGVAGAPRLAFTLACPKGEVTFSNE